MHKSVLRSKRLIRASGTLGNRVSIHICEIRHIHISKYDDLSVATASIVDAGVEGHGYDSRND